MAGRTEFVDFVLESLQPLGGVGARRMFGGWGIYKDGVMFALVARDQLFLKVDDGNRAAYDEAGLLHFTYVEKGRPIRMSYREAPPEGFDDPDILCAWARDAHAAALRARKPKRRPSPS
ncbi:MAG TPA: TfoX/Sxy family protein [Geminicoccaceae bacterium]|nr:TfoX/Sxy family protein [Geminicoccaceae bacterium]